VIHNYRWRLGIAQGEAHYDDIERRLAAAPAIPVPAITLDGDADGVVAATDGSAQAACFRGRRSHRIVAGAGHNLPQEAPRAFADAVLDATRS
jgi:pimeloyl-ACP methyl ester carboxylesterase